jgi:hypothetical protein
MRVSKDIELDLRILPLDSLFPHERVILPLLDSLVKDMQKSGQQRDPILIDNKTKLILDGMHRDSALKILGAKLAVCACFDYLHDTITLARWLRYLKRPDKQTLEKLLTMFDFEPVENNQIAIKLVDTKQAPIALLSNKRAFVSKEKPDLLTVYRYLGDFDRLAEERGLNIEFHSETEDINEPLLKEESTYVLYPLSLVKQDIVDLIPSGRVLPYKTTRHTVPVRPIGLNYPLELLKRGNLRLCEAKLEELVGESTTKVLPPDSTYGGRQYSEPLVIFEHNNKQN